MPAEGRENPLLKKGNSDAFFREKYLTKNNAEVLRPMTYKNGEILMMDHSAKPTEDCMFSNPMETGVLKLQNTASWGADKKGGGIAVYNLTDREQPFALKPADIPELELADSYWLYDYFKKRVFLINKQDQYNGIVEKDGFGWFVLLPKEKNGSCLGLLDKYVGFTAVESIYENDNTDIIVVREAGTIGYISDQEPQKVMVNSEDVTDQIKKTGLLLSRKLNDALSSRLFYAHFDSHRDISHFKSSCFCELFF